MYTIPAWTSCDSAEGLEVYYNRSGILNANVDMPVVVDAVQVVITRQGN